MDRKAMAHETLDILARGFYEPTAKRRIVIKEDLKRSVADSTLISPEAGKKLC